MRSLITSLFRAFFSVPSFHRFFYGVHKRILVPLKLLKGQVKSIRLPSGIALELRIDDWIQESIYFLSTYEPKETCYLQSILHEGDILVDVGANIGFHSLIAAQVVGQSGRVIAFEPFESNYRQLETNVSLNQFDQITLEQIAVADSNGTMNLYVNEEADNLGTVSTIKSATSTAHRPTESICLDDYLTNKQIQHVHFIKLDIEGGELAALKGMTNTLKTHPILMVELDEDILSNTQHSAEDIIYFLADFDYQPFYFTHSGDLSEIQEDSVSKNVIFKPQKNIQTNTSL